MPRQKKRRAHIELQGTDWEIGRTRELTVWANGVHARVELLVNEEQPDPEIPALTVFIAGDFGNVSTAGHGKGAHFYLTDRPLEYVRQIGEAMIVASMRADGVGFLDGLTRRPAQ